MKIELVTNLKRRATEIIRDLNEKHEPILITEHGKPAAYLIDVQSFQEITKKNELLEGLARGESAIKQGRVVSQKEAKKSMKKWLA
ncbi:type II toxin-antitoxin system Phd/YefM family antitoxin [Pelagicoccus mobilis]|uniref:Antitoxin n=1 Tax=Pelagicoccus mobilis TaxID=415221 RepID=A0A934S7E8_9BACT|nr:type II toxin-antitoxin system Phd/YefM family antitoxin [Pelagicoccus mobilis]MBK1880734.1 type II toxin-antitoxin system Phd/YefM family antitoxin [Pelagicoccus mobilis]